MSVQIFASDHLAMEYSFPEKPENSGAKALSCSGRAPQELEVGELATNMLVHYQKRRIHGNKADISVERGVVTVSGKAKNAAEKELVSKRFEDIPGVISIHDRLIIE
jgi:hypothetical protein